MSLRKKNVIGSLKQIIFFSKKCSNNTNLFQLPLLVFNSATKTMLTHHLPRIMATFTHTHTHGWSK